MNSKTIDLDKEEALILVSYGGMKYALDRDKIIELLDKKMGLPQGKRSLASLGKTVGGFAGKATLSETDCNQLIDVLASFGGHIPSGTTSQLGHHLRAVSAMRGATNELDSAVKAFLIKFHQLEKVARRGTQRKKRK